MRYAVAMVLTLTKINQILSAVGATSIPANLNRDELRKDLDSAKTSYQTRAKLRAGKMRLQLKLENTAKTARRLKVSLTDAEVWREISQSYPIAEEDPKEILELLITAVNKRFVSSRPQPLAPWLARKVALDDRSAFEWLAGQRLPKLFKKHFNRKASPRNAKGAPDTPYTRFAKTALTALGISHNGKPYAFESIVRAMTSAATGRKRRHGHMGNVRKEN